MSRHWYCPYCGELVCSYDFKCLRCKRAIRPKEAEHECEYYGQKSIEKYGDRVHWYEFLMEEIKQCPQFDPALASIKKTQEEKDKETSEWCQAALRRNAQLLNVPICPTCHSTRVKRISATKKAVHGFLFGALSQTAISQYQCESCGHKW